MNFPTFLLCVALAVCGFLLMMDGDVALTTCQAAGESSDACYMAINP